MSFESRVLEFNNLTDEIRKRMPLVDGKIFKDKYVYIDFHRYNKCIFTNCTLVFEFGLCSLTNCSFDSCKFEAKHGSPASLILKLDRLLRESAFKKSIR